MASQTRQLLHLSHLSDEEYLKHLWTKEHPADEDTESAVRLELLMGAYDHLLEQVNELASDRALSAETQLQRIRHLTERARRREEARLQ